MGCDPLEVFCTVFHTDLDDASVPITDLDGTRTGASTACFNSERHSSYAAIVGHFPCGSCTVCVRVHFFYSAFLFALLGIKREASAATVQKMPQN